jgi:inosine-uridine nucleoside N-ribohydrolase
MPVRSRPAVIPGSSVPLSSRSPLRNAGVERILSESRSFTRDRRLTVLVIGAATDTASALLANPELAERIEIVAMGFKGWTEGGDEFNIQNDPLAWQVILDSGVPVTVGDGTVTKRDLAMTSARAHALLDRTGNPGRYLAGLLDDWFAKHRDVVQQVTGDAKIWPVWDEVTVAHLLGMTTAERRARPKLRTDLTFDHSATRGTVMWVTAIDGDRLWKDLANRIKTSTPRR